MPIKTSVKGWLSALLATILLIPAALAVVGTISFRVVLTESMQPNLNPGDLVVSANWIKPLPGEVGIYRQRDFTGIERQLVVHRVVTIENDAYLFKGDNNFSPDALAVPSSDVLGTVYLKIPQVGNLLSINGLLALLAIFLGVFAITKGVRRLR